MNNTDTISFCPQLVDLLQASNARGLSTTNNLITLRNLFVELKPSRSLEIGLAYGASALLFTASHREASHRGDHQHTAIDPFQDAAWNGAGLLNIENAGLSDYLDFRHALSGVALPQLIAEGAEYELIYIDGSHLFEDVFIDFYFSTRLLAEGGVVAFDDSSDSHVKKVIKFISSNCGFAYEPMDLGPYRADKGKSLRYQIGKLVNRTQLTAFRKIGPDTRKWDSPFVDF